ncbi:hypothetical protein PM10SUCC1_17050 [Propionigenium maris DSM 9537]|uniref:FMN-binding domain-containing protein n=1 Tax=Propionigenium maris DSM 9537 TaxID=1123000 RepID=A0A9W6LMC3_9FUSO|nr:hypothetical protein [Propionigenium maris]GLI56191.1 hypothetical protein PM10SUCC1_17050 [Propionigenium maris DSM 9537]
MKKISKLMALFALVSSMTMAGEYIPGTYRGAQESTHKRGFSYTNFITMIVGEEGRIDQVIIDATFPVDARDLNKGFTTKQLMGESYGMKAASGIGREWNEQADAIAAHVVENQGISFEVNEDKTTDAIAGASMKVNYYVSILEELIAQARAK